MENSGAPRDWKKTGQRLDKVKKWGEGKGRKKKCD